MNSSQPHDSEDSTLLFCRSSGDGKMLYRFDNPESGGFKLGIRLEERYLLKSHLGQGGMGRVFLAKDERLNREVAIKVLKKPNNIPEGQQDLEGEAKIGASLQHPNIAAVFDFGFKQDHTYTVFEFVDGETLRDILKRQDQLSVADVQKIIGQLSRALDYSHSKGIIHRDLKPENVCVTRSGQFKILDLGLARDTKLESSFGFYSGTPSYSSPEQASCQLTDARTDQYSLAVIAYELLTGRRPFRAESPADMLLNHIRTPVPNPQEFRADIPDQVANALVRALSKAADDRFATCQEFALALGDQSLSIANPVVHVKEGERKSFYICHAPEDSIVAQKICKGIEASGYSCWLYQRDALPGVPLSKQVRNVLPQCHAVLALISRSFLGKPNLVEELGSAHALGRIFFPLLVDMTAEEFDGQNVSWRGLLGPAALLQLENRRELDEMIERLILGAGSVGIHCESNSVETEVSRNQKSLSSRAWATDAVQIDIDDLDRIVFKNELISDFLNRRSKMFLSATKGLGKTLLLTYKRHLLMQEESIGRNLTVIPAGRPYLDFMSELRSLSEKYVRPLSDLNTCKRLWTAAIRISLLSHQNNVIQPQEEFELESFPRRFVVWLKGTPVQPTVVFKEFTSLPVSELNRLIDETENFLDQKLRGIHNGICVFIDKVDQAVRYLNRMAWINIQAGLIEAAWETMNANSHVRIFASIREEAFTNYESDVKSNLLGATTQLQYSENELSEMLDQLSGCYENSDGFRQFVGFNVIRHPIRSSPEDSFQFVHRHTFGRPRDLVAMASEFSSIRNSLSEDRFRSTVFQTSATSLVNLIFDEVKVFMTCLTNRDDRTRFFSLIPQNILTQTEAVRVCEMFNGLPEDTLQHFDTASEKVFHPFRDLFLAGLLGIVDTDSETGETFQRFRQPNDFLLDEGFELPDSERYLIHPALNTFIASHRTQHPYVIFQQFLIGHKQPWFPFFGVFCELEKLINSRDNPEIKMAVHRILNQFFASWISNREQAGSHFSSANPDWKFLIQKVEEDEISYWLEVLKEYAAENA